MRVHFYLASAFLLSTLAYLPSCRKSEPPPPPAPVEKPPEPGAEYSDPSLQSEYETAWRRYLNQYEAPEVGEYIWVRRNDGAYAGGEVKTVTSSTLTLRDGTNELSVARTEVTPETLANVWADAFARKEALAEVEASKSFHLNPSEKTPLVGTTRYSVSDNIIPRSGPANRFAREKVPDLDRGTVLEVLEQRGIWIRVKPQGREDSFWVNALATRPVPTEPYIDATPLITALMQRGILTDYDPAQSIAYIPRGVWIGSHPGIREGLSRLLAENSAHARNSKIEWLEVKDSDSNRRLARYSQSQGFRQQQ